MPGDIKEIGEVTLIDAQAQHEQYVQAFRSLQDINANILAAVRYDGCEILGVDANARTAQYPRLRVALLIFAAKTAGDVTLSIGSKDYAFTVPAQPVSIPFPLVIERGTDILYTATDGRIYIVARTE
jgi:hypothetical protein